MRARSLSAQGRAVSEPPERPREVAGQEPGDRGREGALLFGYFLLGKQEKVTPSQGCEGNSQGRESVFAKRRKSKKMQMDSGLTRATRSPFGPASLFARCARSRRNDGNGSLPSEDRDFARTRAMNVNRFQLRVGR